MEIRSCGSMWAGDKPHSIEKLLEVLKTETLHPMFEEFGNFAFKLSPADRAKLGHEYCLFGNFWSCSFVFSIYGTKAELLEVARAIRRNQRTKAYKQAKQEEEERKAQLAEFDRKAREKRIQDAEANIRAWEALKAQRTP